MAALHDEKRPPPIFVMYCELAQMKTPFDTLIGWLCEPSIPTSHRIRMLSDTRKLLDADKLEIGSTPKTDIYRQLQSLMVTIMMESGGFRKPASQEAGFRRPATLDIQRATPSTPACDSCGDE